MRIKIKGNCAFRTLSFSYLLQIVRHLLGGRGAGCLHWLHSRSPFRTACPRCMLPNCIVYRYICINSAAHKTTTITSTSHWHLSFTLQRHCVLKNHWNNNINNCMCVWFCVRLYGCVCVFCLVDGFFSVYLTVFALHSASASTSTRAQVSTATAIELSHERVKCGLGLRFRCLFLYLITFHLAANSLGASFRKFAFWIGNIDFCYR